MLVDEVLVVGDADFQKKCLGKMDDVAQAGRTILFVSHNMAAVQRLCGRAVLLDRGTVAAAGPIGEVVGRYLAGDAPAREAARFEPRARTGTGWARITDVRVLDDSDRPVAGRPCDSDLRFELEVAVARTEQSGGSLRGLVLELVICSEREQESPVGARWPPTLDADLQVPVRSPRALGTISGRAARSRPADRWPAIGARSGRACACCGSSPCRARRTRA